MGLHDETKHREGLEMSKVLCCRKSEIPQAWLTGGLVKVSASKMFDVLGLAAPRWVERCEAEVDEAIVQIIPYATLELQSGKIAMYRRAGSEGRLHGLASVGVGGHIDPGDATGDFGWMRTIQEAIAREVLEELPGIMAVNHDWLGVLHDPSTPVGRVHMGVAMRLFVCGPVDPGPEILDLAWLDPGDVIKANYTQLEPWSRMMMDEIGATIERKDKA